MTGRRTFRAYARRHFDAMVSVQVGAELVSFRLCDLGLGGAGIEGTRAVAAGARVALVLQTPTRWDALVLPATVAWSEGLRCGLRFEAVNERDLYALYEMLGTQAFD